MISDNTAVYSHRGAHKLILLGAEVVMVVRSEGLRRSEGIDGRG